MRDLLLGRPVRDVDLVVEGDAAGFARALAGKLGGRVREHDRFATATLKLPGGSRLDVASARRESYSGPGALPRVRPASIEEDLFRRDFTVNAMAMELAPAGRARLLDPFGGRRDLAARVLSFLHPRSPCDDPTRAFRAVRYANRLGFRVALDAVGAIRRSIEAGAFVAVSGDRLWRELELIFAETGRADAVRRMSALGLARVLGAGLAADSRTLSRLRRAEALLNGGSVEGGGLLFLLVWAAGRSQGDLDRLADRLALAGAAGRSMRSWGRTWRGLGTLRKERRRSRIRRLAAGLSPAEIGALAAGLPRREAARLCDVANRPVLLSIGGRDLVAAGVPAGPALGRALAETLEAREDGMIGAREELDFALRRARLRNRMP